MIVYLETSALVKRYVAEAGSGEVGELIAQADAVGTTLITRVEVATALTRAARVGLLTHEQARAVLGVFRAQWADLIRLQLTETIIARADALAWDRSLPGTDALHLAAALGWQETLGESVTFATFGRTLWQAAAAAGLAAWPQEMRPVNLDAP
jgi:predicted nucleic acid-binding protein